MRGLEGRVLAIVNPAAGKRRAARHVDELVRLFLEAGRRVDVARTAEPGDGARLARQAADEGYARVIAVGGDGTVHEVANGLLGSEVSLAVVPLGLANDFAASLGIPLAWRAAARLAILGRLRRVDAALANGRAFVNAVGVGVDAVGARALDAHKRYFGPFSYLTAAVATLATYRPRRIRVELDGETIDGPHLLVVAANTDRFAKGMRIAPGAVPDDGLLDVCVVGDTIVPEAILLLAKVYRGAHIGHPKVRLLRAPSLVLEQEGDLPVELDGELSTGERVEIECVPRGITVVVP